jgi:hypothetical protein
VPGQVPVTPIEAGKGPGILYVPALITVSPLTESEELLLDQYAVHCTLWLPVSVPIF